MQDNYRYQINKDLKRIIIIITKFSNPIQISTTNSTTTFPNTTINNNPSICHLDTNLKLKTNVNILFIINNIHLHLEHSSAFKTNTTKHINVNILLQGTLFIYKYVQFKVNRPRFYLVKPDRGYIVPNGNAQISIKLHKQGISQANTDKFKCYFIRVNNSNDINNQKSMDKFQQKPDTQHYKFTVIVNNIPAGIQSVRNIPTGGTSQLKSLQNTKFSNINSSVQPISISGHTSMTNINSSRNVNNYSNNIRNSTTDRQSYIYNCRERVQELRNQIQIMKKSDIERKIALGPSSYSKNKGSSVLPIIIIAIIGILLGLISSVWI